MTFMQRKVSIQVNLIYLFIVYIVVSICYEMDTVIDAGVL